ARTALHRGDLIEPPGASAWDRLQVAAALAPQAPEVQRALEEYERAASDCLERRLAENALGQARACRDALAARRGVLPAGRRRVADRWLGYAEERLGVNELDLAWRALRAARDLDPANPRLDLIAQRRRRADRGLSAAAGWPAVRRSPAVPLPGRNAGACSPGRPATAPAKALRLRAGGARPRRSLRHRRPPARPRRDAGACPRSRSWSPPPAGHAPAPG